MVVAMATTPILKKFLSMSEVPFVSALDDATTKALSSRQHYTVIESNLSTLEREEISAKKTTTSGDSQESTY